MIDRAVGTLAKKWGQVYGVAHFKLIDDESGQLQECHKGLQTDHKAKN